MQLSKAERDKRGIVGGNASTISSLITNLWPDVYGMDNGSYLAQLQMLKGESEGFVRILENEIKRMKQ